jgi:hypothetical protein
MPMGNTGVKWVFNDCVDVIGKMASRKEAKPTRIFSASNSV